ncbi:MAG: phosphate-selective porin O and P [Halobacteria archaeon]|nr:phosphate-selective porin O and P [Halobacteria archaeon]
MRNKLFKRATLAVVCAGGLLAGTAAHAANWLMLQGTEPAGAAARAKLWGFVQVQYQKDFSDPNAGGGYIPPKLIGPNLDSQSAFNVNRARIGVRGSNFPLDSNTNYFLLLEMGNNGITASGDSFAKATDASVTFNHIPGARVRTGLFKYPGAEEGLQAIHVFDYINFTSVTNQMLLERYANSSYPNPDDIPPQPTPAGALNGLSRGVGAFRDVGIQVFDTFKVGQNKDWEASYALMVGNGNGLNFSDNDDDKDIYLYVSAEKVFGGKGPRRQGMKFWAWHQDGERTADLTNDATVNPVSYDRDRSGLGFKYLKKPYRFTAEYMTGDGMIFLGPHHPTFGLGPGIGNPGAPGNGVFSEADGWYVEGGWYIPGTNWEIDARYDIYNRMTDNNFEFEFKRLTLGTQYHFNKKTRVAVNYELAEAEAVNFASGAGPNGNLDGIDDRIAIQVTAIY